MTFRALIVIPVCASLLGGCVAAMLGAATVTTIDVVHERRTLGAYIDDGAIELQIQQAMMRNDEVSEETSLSPTSMNGIVLLTGQAQNAAVKNRVIDYIEQLEGVRQVVDESEITDRSGLRTQAHDGWLTTKVKTALYRGTGFDANRVKVVTEQRTVYLMGLLSRAEAARAVDVARHVDGVARVVKVFEYTDSGPGGAEHGDA